MVFSFLSGFYLTNKASELKDFEKKNVKVIDLTMNDMKHNVSKCDYYFSNIEPLCVYFRDLDILKQFLKNVIIKKGNGSLYVDELDHIIDMNLGC